MASATAKTWGTDQWRRATPGEVCLLSCDMCVAPNAKPTPNRSRTRQDPPDGARKLLRNLWCLGFHQAAPREAAGSLDNPGSRGYKGGSPEEIQKNVCDGIRCPRPVGRIEAVARGV